MPDREGLVDACVLSAEGPDAQIFAGVVPIGKYQRYGDGPGSFFERLTANLGLKDVGFHSFRHTVRTAIANAPDAFPDQWIARLIGQAADIGEGARYTKEITVPNLQRMVESLDFRDVLSAVKPGIPPVTIVPRRRRSE